MSQSLVEHKTETKLDDDLALILKDECSTEEQQLFLTNFQLYLTYGRNNREFVVDLDDVYKWAGFSRKYHAKQNLIKNFENKTDYVIENSLPPERERVGERN